MENKDSDNIYVYSEDETLENEETTNNDDLSNLDKSGPNYSQVNESPDEYVLEDDEDDQQPSVSPLLLMFKVLINPIEGWKSVRRSRLTPERAQQGCFYPLLALLAATKFLLLAYHSTLKLQTALIDAVNSFVSFFFGYFCIIIFLKIALPGNSGKNFETNFGKVFVIISLSTLCLFYALADALPMLWAILIFLPMWTIYIICRGTKFFKFPENRAIFSTFILSLTIVGFPLLISWIMELMLPA